MNGMFDLTLINNRGKDDQYFQDAIDGKYIMDALNDLPTVRHLPGKRNQNRIFDNMAGMYLESSLQGPNQSDAQWRYIAEGANSSFLHWLTLSNLSSATSSYTEDSNKQTSFSTYSISHTNVVANSVNTSSASKRFIEDDITDPTIWSDTAREAIHFRNRFLWLPSQGNSNAIKSIEIWASEVGTQNTVYGNDIGRVGRVRLRDSAGVYTTLNKTSSNSLLVEYTYTLVSW
jgi:hypothetical protein